MPLFPVLCFPWPLGERRNIWTFGCPRDGWLWVPCQSWLLYSGSKLSNRLLTTNNPLCSRGAFLLGNCECFARVSLLVFPTAQWGMKMAEGDSSSSLLLAREQTQVAYFEAVLHLSWVAIWSLPELASTWGGDGGGGEAWLHRAVSWDKSKNTAFPF